MFLGVTIDSRRRTPKIFLTNVSEFRKWKYFWGIIEQTNDSASVSESCEIPIGGFNPNKASLATAWQTT